MVLTLLHQHRFLTTEDVVDLLYPTPSGDRQAQIRLAWLQRMGLIEWPRSHASYGHWHRVSSPLWLTPRGAVQLAGWLHVEAAPVIRRAANAHTAESGVDHSLQVVRFFTWLARLGAETAEEGLAQWIGDDAMRRNYHADGAEMSPDGWGRYLLPDGEVRFNLEWDMGSETRTTLAEKGARYVAYHGKDQSRATVLFVGPTPHRAEVIARCLPAADRRVAFLTSHVDLLVEKGPLGAIWTPVAGGEPVTLRALGSPRRSAAAVEDCIGRPGWWSRRTFGAEA